MSRISGSHLLSSFDTAISNLASESSDLDRQIGTIESAISRATDKREEALSELADIYCDNREKLREELSAVTKDLQTLFDERKKRRQAVEADIERLTASIAAAKKQLAAAIEKRGCTAEELAVTQKKVEEELAGDADFKVLKSEFESSDKRRLEAAESLVGIKKECSAKIADYLKNPFFSYLVNRKFGTPEYRGFPIAKSIDGWLAANIDWNVNFSNYRILVRLPDFSEKRCEDIARNVEVFRVRMSARATQSEQKQGCTEAKLRYKRHCDGVDQMNKTIEKYEADLDTLRSERKAMEQNKDAYVQKAKKAIKSMLADESVQSLRIRVVSTNDKRDDALVTAIEDAESVINSSRARIKRLRSDRAAVEERQRKASTARRKFSSDYTGNYDRFDGGLNMDSLITGFILGKTTESSFWSTVSDSHHDETPSYNYSSSSSDSSSSSSGWGSSDSGSSSFSFGGGDSGGGCSFGGGD